MNKSRYHVSYFFIIVYKRFGDSPGMLGRDTKVQLTLPAINKKSPKLLKRNFYREVQYVGCFEHLTCFRHLSAPINSPPLNAPHPLGDIMGINKFGPPPQYIGVILFAPPEARAIFLQ